MFTINQTLLQFFLLALVQLSKHPKHFQNSMCSFQKHSYKQHHTMDYLQKPVTLSKGLLYVSKVNNYVNVNMQVLLS